MKRFKKLSKLMPIALSVMVLSSGFGLEAFAGDKEARAQKRAAFMQTLNLTEDQQAQMKSIRSDFKAQYGEELKAMKAKRKELKALRESGNLSKEDMQAKREALKAEGSQLKEAKMAMMQDIRSILTAEQAAQFDAMKAQRKEKKHSRRDNNQPRF